MKCPMVAKSERIAKLRTESRGYPVPFFLDCGDATDFRQMSYMNVARCIHDCLCAICGEPMSYWIVFMGGPVSCQNGVFTDPPMHPSCADYVVQVCPFILSGGWSREFFREKRPDVIERDPDGILTQYDTHVYITRGYRLEQSEGGGVLFVARPAVAVRRIEPTLKPARVA